MFWRRELCASCRPSGSPRSRGVARRAASARGPSFWMTDRRPDARRVRHPPVSRELAFCLYLRPHLLLGLLSLDALPVPCWPCSSTSRVCLRWSRGTGFSRRQIHQSTCASNSSELRPKGQAKPTNCERPIISPHPSQIEAKREILDRDQNRSIDTQMGPSSELISN